MSTPVPGPDGMVFTLNVRRDRLDFPAGVSHSPAAAELISATLWGYFPHDYKPGQVFADLLAAEPKAGSPVVHVGRAILVESNEDGHMILKADGPIRGLSH